MGREDRINGSRADSGEKYYHFEFAVAQTIKEGEDIGAIGNRHFAHGGRDKWLAALLPQENAHFFGAAGLERQDAKTGEAHA